MLSSIKKASFSFFYKWAILNVLSHNQIFWVNRPNFTSSNSSLLPDEPVLSETQEPGLSDSWINHSIVHIHLFIENIQLKITITFYVCEWDTSMTFFMKISSILFVNTWKKIVLQK